MGVPDLGGAITTLLVLAFIGVCAAGAGTVWLVWFLLSHLRWVA